MWILGWTWLFLLHLFCLGAVGLGPAWEALPFWICLGSELLIFLGSNWPSLHPDKQCADTGNSNNNWLWRQSSPDMDWEDSSFLFFSICYIFLCTASGYSGVRFCLESTAEATPEAFQQTNPSCSISYSGPVPLSNPETLWRCYAAEKSCSSTATWKIYVTSPVQNPKKPPAPSSPSLRKQARRYKRKGKLGCGNGSAPVINPGENALSIPQITYDHIGEQEDKKAVSFYIEEPGVKNTCLGIKTVSCHLVEGKGKTYGSAVCLIVSVSVVVTVMFFKQNHGLLPGENQGHSKPQELQDAFKYVFTMSSLKKGFRPLTEGMCQLRAVSQL